MKHLDNYHIILHRKDEDFEPIAILFNADKDSIKSVIANLFDSWCYEDSKENINYLNTIVDSLYNNQYYEDDFDTFYIKTAPYYE